MSSEELLKKYLERYDILKATADRIASMLKNEVLAGVPHIDQISARAKEPSRFVQKASITDEHGNLKYVHPLEEIQDQIGCRIVVYYLSDVQAVADKLLRNYNEVEDREVIESGPDQFSYRARHFICEIPGPVRRELDTPVNVFEIQVSTLFQHAWAEANHDLGYKSSGALPFESRRYLAFTAAQAWGADTVFELIRESLRTSTSEDKQGS